MIMFKAVSEHNFNQLQFVVQGDDAAIVLKVNLAKPPFEMNFNGNTPAGFQIDLGAEDVGEATATVETTADGDILTITFTQAPPASETIGINLAPFYASLP